MSEEVVMDSKDETNVKEPMSNELEQAKPKTRDRLVALPVALMSIAYLANIQFGIFGFFDWLPDNLPFIGNLDEAFFTGLLLWAWKKWKGDK